MTTALQILGIVFGIFAASASLYALHRGLISLEDRGYIYYRESPRSGFGGALMEMDRLSRPSVEHVEKAMDSTVKSVENDGE